MKKHLYYLSLILVAIWLIVSLGQLWFELLSPTIWFKVSCTIGGIILLLMLISITIDEIKSENEMKKENYLR